MSITDRPNPLTIHVSDDEQAYLEMSAHRMRRLAARSGLEGNAKLFDVDCKSGDFSQSGRHLGGIIVPQAEGIGSGMTIGDGGKSIAAGAEDDADLVVGSKEPLRLPR